MVLMCIQKVVDSMQLYDHRFYRREVTQQSIPRDDRDRDAFFLRNLEQKKTQYT